MDYMRLTHLNLIFILVKHPKKLWKLLKKKFNKIILISNVGSDLGGKEFIINARKIIGSEIVVLFLCYNIKHLDWIKNFKNALFSNEASFYEEYLKCFMREKEPNGYMKWTRRWWWQ